MDAAPPSPHRDPIRSLNEKIDHALGLKEVAAPAHIRQIVRRFDVDFDVPLKHDRCLGLLTLLGATERQAWTREGWEKLPPEKLLEEMEQLAGFLGAATCKIVRGDLAYEWVAALRIVSDSRNEAELLAKILGLCSEADIADGIPQHAAYALARWRDASGKINYRFADYSTAQAQFKDALDLAKRARIWSCQPDFASNLKRAQLEVERTSTADELDVRSAAQLAREFETLHQSILAEYPVLAEAFAGLKDVDFQVCEGMRGVSNILHNWAQALEQEYKKTKDPNTLERAMDVSRRSQSISATLGDIYRIAQSELCQGRMLCEHQKDYAEASKLFEKHVDSKWQRGRPIAAQWLARIAHKQRRLGDAATEYQKLIDLSGSAVEVVSQDIASQSFTLKFFRELLQEETTSKAVGEGRFRALRLSERANRLRIVRAVRDVVKIAKYKEDYARYVLPAYLEEIGLRLGDMDALTLPPADDEKPEERSAAGPGATPQGEKGDGDEAGKEGDDDDARKSVEALKDGIFLFAEEVSARELLDAMAATAAEEHNWFEREKALLEDVGGLVRRAAERRSKDAAEGRSKSTKERGEKRHASSSPTPSPMPAPLQSDRRAPVSSAAGGRRNPDRCARLTPDQVERLREQQLALEEEALEKPLTSVRVDPEIVHTVRMFMANEASASEPGSLGHVIVRFLPFEVRMGGGTTARAHVFAPTTDFITRQPLSLDGVLAAARAFSGAAGEDPASQAGRGTPAREIPAAEREPSRPDRLVALARRMHTDIVGPILDELKQKTGAEVGLQTRIVFVPTGPLLSLPLHIALGPFGPESQERPLAAFAQVCFSVSAMAYVHRGRYRLARFAIHPEDDLFAFVRVEGSATGREVAGLGWKPAQFQLQGDLPGGMKESEVTRLSSEEDALRKLVEIKPEFFLYSGHGMFDPRHKDLGPVLDFGPDPVTHTRRLFSQVDVARHVRLPRNKLALLAACVTGLGVDKDGGEVGGFLRAFMAAGSGAIGLTLWNVLDDEVVLTVRNLLEKACPERRASGGPNLPFDVLGELRAHYQKRCDDLLGQTSAWVEACPIALYL